MFHISWLDLLQSKQKLMLAAFIDGKLKTIFIAFVRILWKRHLRALAGPQWDIRVSADEKHWDFGGDAGWVLCRFYKIGGGGHRGEVGVNSICLWFVIPTLEWIISLVSSQNQKGWISNSSYVVPWVCKKSVWLAPLQVEGVDFYGVHNKTHRHHYPTTQYTHRAVKYTITYAPTHPPTHPHTTHPPPTLPFSVWQRSLLQSDRVTEVKRCDTVIVTSPTIARESWRGATTRQHNKTTTRRWQFKLC